MKKTLYSINMPVFVLGIVTGAILLHFVYPYLASSEWWPGHTSHDHGSLEYHIHTDFLIVREDEIIDLSGQEYMTTATSSHHENAHLHDNDDEVLHLHAPGITFAEFLASLNIKLTDSCLTLPNKDQLCSSEETKLVMYVNKELFKEPITTYIPSDLDQVLLYIGANAAMAFETYSSQITDNACLFSGSCPERGLPPPETCGLTCEF